MKNLGDALLGIWAVVVVVGVAGGMALWPPTPPSSGSIAIPAPDPEPATDQMTVVFMGDSITAADGSGYNSWSGALSWVSRMTPEPESPWLMDRNVAVAGETTEQMLARFERDVLTPAPEGVVILAGTNDARLNVPLSEVAANLTAMVRAAQEAGAEVWLISPPPNDQFTDRQRAVVEVVAEVARETEVPFVNIFAAIGEWGQWPEGMTVDGIHPNARGQQAIAETVLQAAT